MKLKKRRVIPVYIFDPYYCSIRTFLYEETYTDIVEIKTSIMRRYINYWANDSKNGLFIIGERFFESLTYTQIKPCLN